MMKLVGGGLQKHGGGLPQVKKYLQTIDESEDDEEEDDEDDEGDSEDEDEVEVAHRQLEARSWREEGENYWKWYVETFLTDRQETVVRTNEEPKDMMNLIKSFI